jgi:hypothetical protein
MSLDDIQMRYGYDDGEMFCILADFLHKYCMYEAACDYVEDVAIKENK